MSRNGLCNCRGFVKEAQSRTPLYLCAILVEMLRINMIYYDMKFLLFGNSCKYW